MPTERRPLDHQLVAQVGRPEEDVVAWWKSRFEQIAAIPSATARAGALVPEWRELAALKEADRALLTRARILGAMRLTQEQQDTISEARDLAKQQVPAVAAGDAAFIRDKVAATLPPDAQRQVTERLARE